MRRVAAMQRRGDDQPTVFSDAGASDRAPSKPHVVSGELPAARSRDGLGIVFVHGIGTQTPGETFLDWSAPIVELLSDWRAATATRR